MIAQTGTFSFYAYSASQNAHGQSHVHCYAGCKTEVVQGARVEQSGGASLMVQDSLALVATEQSQTDNALLGLRKLVARASHLARPSGAALVWRTAPALVLAIDRDASVNLDSLRSVDLLTPVSELCRQAALRFVARNQGAVRDFEIALAQSRPAWGTVKQFNAAMQEGWRSYVSELRPCVAAAPSWHRAELAANMLRF